MNALATYRKHFADGRRYGLPAYALGATQRRHCSEAGALAVPRGLPLPRFEQGKGRIELGDVGLYPGVRLHTEPGARLAVGNGSYLNRNTLVWAAQEVVIGCEAMIAWDVIISDTDGFGEFLDPADARWLASRREPDSRGVSRTHQALARRARAVRIGDGAWIGAKAMILAGADIGDGAVIAAGAVVRERVEPGAIVAAEPARPLLDLRSRA
ncbi:MAG: hypothetical protein DHS20C15_15040 [Planctomycetota bacterium]|nr:MAG: hypothetical protein DHS20C15_15040 [Planctomycetota bacterium]